MTKSTLCSQNWKKLKGELTSENSSKKLKRKLNDERSHKSKKKLKKSDSTIKKNLDRPLDNKIKTKTVSKDEDSSFPRKQATSTNLQSSIPSTPDIWFDDVSMHDIIAAEKGTKLSKNRSSGNKQLDHSSLVKPNASNGLTQVSYSICYLIYVLLDYF